MKILARIVMVLALLAALGYGSYAFGRYVLSNKLFGTPTGGALRTVSSATGQASAVTRHTDWKGAKPRVEVKVLPSDENGPSTVIASDDDKANPSSAERSTSAPVADVSQNSKRTFDDAPIEYSLGDDNSSRSHRKHRKHHSSSSDLAKSATARAEAATTGDSASTPAPTAQGDQSSISVAADDGSVVKAPPLNPEKNSSSEGNAHHARHHNEHTRSHSEKPRTESPVPQPENSAPTGGDSADISPVPQPE